MNPSLIKFHPRIKIGFLLKIWLTLDRLDFVDICNNWIKMDLQNNLIGIKELQVLCQKWDYESKKENWIRIMGLLWEFSCKWVVMCIANFIILLFVLCLATIFAYSCCQIECQSRKWLLVNGCCWILISIL